MRLNTLLEGLQWHKPKDIKEWQDEIFNLIKLAYKDIGGHPNYKSANDIRLVDNQYFEVIDIDGDSDPDAVNAIKKKPAGNKIVASGHDGSQSAKRILIKHKIKLLKTSGYYIEVSGRLYEILNSAGINIVDDEEAVRKVLKKDITWLGDGWYERKIAGKKHKKILMGKPKT